MAPLRSSYLKLLKNSAMLLAWLCMVMIWKLREVYQYREVIWNFVTQDLRVRYQRSILGMLWTLIKPALMLLILTLVFGLLFRRNFQHFVVYLGSGLLAWLFFADAANSGSGAIIHRGSTYLTRVYLPKAVFPFVTTAAALVNFFFSLVALIILMIFLRHNFTIWLIVLPLAITCLALFGMGVSLWLACLTVYLRDLEHLTDVLLRAWFYLTPIIYPIDMIPEKHRYLFYFNPMFHILHLFQTSLYYGRPPDTMCLIAAPLISAFVFLTGAAVFFWREREFVFLV
ncbi:MAG: ABC transporter permease [Deltaproteobacteria bacterium]|nr:ABC transporter permease [Deltaproteobacteria bacterium]